MKSSHFEGCQDRACLIQKPKQGTNGGRCRCSHAKIEAYINALKEERTLSKKRERYDFLPREMPDDRIGPGIPERMKQLSEKPLDLDREITRQYIATIQSQLAAARAEIDSLKAALHNAEAIGDFSEELRDRRRLQESANCVPKLQEELAASQERERILREGLEKYADENNWYEREDFAGDGSLMGFTWEHHLNGPMHAQATLKAAAEVK
jgi:predicted RNase H-like nuclease (RuvC/YqgF family)